MLTSLSYKRSPIISIYEEILHDTLKANLSLLNELVHVAWYDAGVKDRIIAVSAKRQRVSGVDHWQRHWILCGDEAMCLIAHHVFLENLRNAALSEHPDESRPAPASYFAGEPGEKSDEHKCNDMGRLLL